MQLFHTLGSKLGEDGFVSGNQNNSAFSGAMTPAQAQSKINMLRGDPDFVRRYTEGGAKEREEMNRLHEFAHPSE